jgi:hypothetical protein
VRLGAQVPRLTQQPARAVGSAGDDCIAWAESIGWDDELGHGFYVLDEWQKFCIRGILSEDRGANLCALVCLLLVPRQNGKNVVLEVIELYALFVLDLRYILHSAHLTETSADHMARLLSAIESDDDLNSRTKVTVAHGFEKIERTDLRCRIRFRTRSKKVGRGGSPEMAVFDEALYLTDLHQSALLPSLSAQTMRADQPIIVYASSAPVAESEVLHRVRRSILAGEMPDAWMAEWSVPVPEAGDGRYAEMLAAVNADSVLDANPGANVRISVDYVLNTERPQMGLEEWCIERLGMVFEADSDEGVLPADKWAACAREGIEADEGRASLAVGPNGRWAAFGFASQMDGTMCVEVTRHEPGTSWVIDHAKAVTARRGPLVVDPKGSSAGMVAKLRAAGVPLEELAAGDIPKACSAFQDDVLNVQLRYPRMNIELSAAVTGADVRPVGQGWAFTAKGSVVDITPLEAVVLAAWAARGQDETSGYSDERGMRVIG